MSLVSSITSLANRIATEFNTLRNSLLPYDNTTPPTTGQTLEFDGTNYVPADLEEVPAGGIKDSILAKVSGADYDTEWRKHGVPIGGAKNQVLTKATADSYDTLWLDVNQIPNGGTTGQVLAKVDGTNYNTEWVTPATGGATKSFVKRLSTNIVINNDAVNWVEAGDMAIELPAGKLCSLFISITHGSPSNADLQYTFSFTNGFAIGYTWQEVSATSFRDGLTAPVTVPTNGSIRLFTAFGWARSDAGCTMNIQFRQWTAQPANTTIYFDSYIQVVHE